MRRGLIGDSMIYSLLTSVPPTSDVDVGWIGKIPGCRVEVDHVGEPLLAMEVAHQSLNRG